MKWAKKYDQCIDCETKNLKHYGGGLCRKCYAIKRNYNPRTKQIVKDYKNKYYQNHKTDEVFKQKNKIAVKKYEKTAKNKKRLKEKFLKIRFENFIKGKVNKNGIEIVIDGTRVRTPIEAPRAVNSDKDRTVYNVELFKQVYRKHITQ